MGYGTVVTIAGGTAVAGGLLVAAFASLCGVSDQPGACDSRSSTEKTGLLVAGVGAAALVAGIVMLVRNHTTVSGDEPPSASR